MTAAGPARCATSRLRALVVAGLAAAVCAASPPVEADRTSAGYFVARGDKAAKDKNWTEALQNYRRALEEDEHHVPARVGLGEALFASGDRTGSLEAWRLAPADAEAVKPLPAAWNEALTRAKKRLAEADAATAALARIVDGHADALVALAERWETDDPSVTASALRGALRMRPEHPKARPMFERLGSPAGDWTPLFDGRTLDRWTGYRVDESWRVEDGQLIGDMKAGASRLTHDLALRGDFDIRVEAKFIEQYEGRPGFEIGAMKSPIQGTIFGIVGIELNVQEHDGAEKTAMRFAYSCPLDDLANPFDTTEWTTYELRFRGNQTSVLINGNEVVTTGRPAQRHEGQVMLVVQRQKIAFRKVEAMQR